MRLSALVAVLTLVLPLLTACSTADPCEHGDKTDDPEDDIRVHLMLNTGPEGLKAVFELEPGPPAGAGPLSPAQSQTCDPVSTDIAGPTNVVLLARVGDVVRVELQHDDLDSRDHSVECRVTPDAFGPAIGTPGNVFIEASAVNYPASGIATVLVCSAGLEPA
jgi:hypothetical protein